MKRAKTLLIVSVSALAVAALPINFASIAFGDFNPAAAYAKNGNGNGGGNAGGNGGGHGGGNGGGHGSGGGQGNGGGKGSASGKGNAGQHGKSAEAKGRGMSARDKVTVAGSAASSGGRVKGLSENRGQSKKAVVAKSSNKAIRFAGLPIVGPLPEAKPKNFNAKLAGLNSLNRNYHAYLNSQSPRMAAISAFVMDSAEFDLARERVAQAEIALAEAEAEFTDAVEQAGPVPYDGAIGVYDDPAVDSLSRRLDDLNNDVVAEEDREAWSAEVATLEGLLDSEEAQSVAGAETSLDEAERNAAAASVGTDDAALEAALVDAANKNRVAQYGDDYVDDEMMDWAKDLLGVGDAFGPIDQVRDTLED